MAPKKTNANRTDWKSELLAGGDVVRELFRDVLQEVLEAEMTETLQAKPGERTAERLGLRSGY
jgi:transposase-like protein